MPDGLLATIVVTVGTIICALIGSLLGKRQSAEHSARHIPAVDFLGNPMSLLIEESHKMMMEILLAQRDHSRNTYQALQRLEHIEHKVEHVDRRLYDLSRSRDT